jgi:hypothetical protein
VAHTHELEALQTLDEKWTAIIQAAAAKGDEDTAADYGNDLMQLHTLREGFEAKAVQAFGPAIKDFSRDSVAVTTLAAPNGEQPRPR